MTELSLLLVQELSYRQLLPGLSAQMDVVRNVAPGEVNGCILLADDSKEFRDYSLDGMKRKFRLRQPKVSIYPLQHVYQVAADVGERR